MHFHMQTVCSCLETKNVDLISITEKGKPHNLASAVAFSACKINILTCISIKKGNLKSHCSWNNKQINSWNLCLNSFDLNQDLTGFLRTNLVKWKKWYKLIY